MRNHHRRKKKISSFIKLAILAFCGVAFWLYNGVYSSVEFAENTTITIKSGTTVSSLASKLEEQEAIKSALLFKTFASIFNLDNKLQAGTFQVSGNLNTPDLLKVLTSSPEQIIFTIQEGLMIKEIDKKLSAEGHIEAGEFLNVVKNFSNYSAYPFIKANNNELPLEGYIYPDTYYLDPAKPAADLIEKSLNNFKSKTAGLDLSYEDLIMASIVETEVFGYQDRQKVAGLLWKRLENNWLIGADITILYITDDRVITSADLKIESPYNTRKNRGLPPGPVSNPSIESINATLNPITTPYWFYLTTLDTGEVIYSRTNEEHNLNRAKYL